MHNLNLNIVGRRRLQGIPFSSDLNFRSIGRSGIIMVDTIAENDAVIIPSCGYFNISNYIIPTIANFRILDTSGYIEAKFYFDGTTNRHMFFSTADESTTTDYFAFSVVNKFIYLEVRALGVVSNTLKYETPLTEGWYTIRWMSNGSAYFLLINGESKEFATTGENNGFWLDKITGRDNIGIGVMKYTSMLRSPNLKIVYIDYNNTHKWILTGIGKYEYDVIGTLHVSYTGTSHLKYDEESNLHLLDKGYSIYSKTGQDDAYVPYTDEGLPNDVSAFLVPAGYELNSNHEGLENYHNLTPTYINIPLWNRSNETIFNATARTGLYLITNPTWWHVSEINRDVISSYLNESYTGTLFPNLNLDSIHNRNYIKELFSYDTNKTGSDLIKVLLYTNDYQYVFTEQYDGLFDNSVLISDEGTYKIRNAFSRYSFAYYGTAISIKANPTIYASSPQYSHITILIDGIFYKKIDIIDTDYIITNLPSGNKIVTLIEGLITNSGTIVGTFITSVLEGVSYVKQDIISSTERLVFIGDSITVGDVTEIPAVQSFPNLFSVDNDKVVSTYGWGGAKIETFAETPELIADAVSKLVSLFYDSTDKKLIIALGTNDYGIDSTPAAIIATWYGNLLDAINAADEDIVVYCCAPLYRNGETSLLEDYRIAISGLCDTRDYAVYANIKNSVTYPTNYHSDGVHPITDGHAQIKSALYDIIY